MKYGGFIFGADEEHQKKQRKGIRALAKAQSAEVKWFVETEGRQKTRRRGQRGATSVR